MALYKVHAAHKPTAELETFVGDKGELFYSEADPRLRISDGSTPGGIVISSSATQDVDLSAVAQNILPAEDVTYDLGSLDKQWRDLYLSGSTLYIGGVPAVQKDPDTGQITLPENARIRKPDGTTQSLDPTSVTQDDINLALYLEDLLNIDITNLRDGSLLQYNGNTSKWEAKNVIETAGLTINGGAF